VTTTNSPADDATFANELQRLKVKGRDTEPERWLMWVGVAAFVAGIVIVIVALQSAHTTADPLVQNERIILAALGTLIGLAGVIVWARYSLTRYFRYWLLRVIFEERLQQDRTIEVLERIEKKLGGDAS
jgi:cytochrome c biogenesis protein CcdA